MVKVILLSLSLSCITQLVYILILMPTVLVRAWSEELHRKVTKVYFQPWNPPASLLLPP